MSHDSIPQVYLAIGSFQDLGLNNRFATFPAQLRAYLTTAYQGSRITVLERESVQPLLQEMQMDQAGLTQGAAARPTKMAAAFWIVDGFYQSYKTSGLELDLALRVQRVFGGTVWFPFVRNQASNSCIARRKRLTSF